MYFNALQKAGALKHSSRTAARTCLGLGQAVAASLALPPVPSAGPVCHWGHRDGPLASADGSITAWFPLCCGGIPVTGGAVAPVAGPLLQQLSPYMVFDQFL